MAKIIRVLQKIFAGNSNETGVFGSAAADTFVKSTDIEEIQSLDAWESGWTAATLTTLKLPTLNETEGVSRVVTQQIAYLLQEGVPEYNADTVYYENSIVKETGTAKLYKSLSDDNEDNALSDDANWILIIDFDAIVSFNNLSATTAPSSTDDETEGYVLGSLWIDETNSNAYIAVDVSEGAAVWLNLNIESFLDGLTEEAPSEDALLVYQDPNDYNTFKKGSLLGLIKKNNYLAVAEPTVNDDETEGYTVGSEWLFSGLLYVCLDASDGAAVWATLATKNYVDTSSSWKLIESKAATSSPTLNFTTGLAAYGELLIFFTGVLPVDDGAIIRMLVSINGGSSFLNSGYNSLFHSAVVGDDDELSGSQFLFTTTQGNQVSEEIRGSIRMTKGSATVPAEYSGQIRYENTSGALVVPSVSGFISPGGVIDALSFFYNSGNIASGTISVFGR
jgi:hypothetical protein